MSSQKKDWVEEMNAFWSSAHGLVLSAVLAAGCAAGASWKEVKVQPGYKAPKELTVVLANNASNADGRDEAVEAFKERLVDELADEDIKVTFASAPSGVGADVTVAEWDPGNRALRMFVGFGAGRATILVTVKTPGISGAAEGWVRGGMFGGSSTAAAEEAGALIAEAIATGEVD